MTKTPKTDAAMFYQPSDRHTDEVVSADVARQLELENYELKTILEQCRLFVSITPHDSAFFDRICQALAK